MAIRVEHGGPGLAGLAGLLAGAGQRRITQRAEDERTARIAMQTRSQRQVASQRAAAQAASNRAAAKRQAASIGAQRSNTHQQIQAQSQRQSQAADQAFKRMYIQAGLQGEFQEQAYDREIQKMEEQAKQRASERKMIYSEDGKRRMAEWNRAKEYALDPESPMGPMNSPERAALLKRAEMGVASVPQHSIPAPGPKPPEGFAPYQSGTLPNGMGYLVGPDGKITTQPYEHTKEGYVTVQRIKQEEVQRKETAAHQAKIDSFVASNWNKEVSVAVPGDPGYKFKALGGLSPTFGATDPSEEKKVLGQAGARAMAEKIFGPTPGQAPAAAPEAAQPQQVPPPQRGSSGWQNSPSAENLIIYESDLQVPAQVGYAQAYMRTVLRNFGPKKGLWLKETRDAFEKARKIVQDFQRPSLGTR